MSENENSQDQEQEYIPKTIEDLAGGPFIFFILDGRTEDGKKRLLKLELDDWTIDAEKWAKKHYGSMQALYNCLMHIGVDDDATIDAAIAVAHYKLTPESKDKINERRGEVTTENYLRSKINFKLLAELCRAEFEMIKESIPLDALKKTQEILSAMQKSATTSSTT